VPAGLGLAVATYLLDPAFQEVVAGDPRRSVYSMLLHVDHRESGHRNAIAAVQAIVDRMEDALRGDASETTTRQVFALLEDARQGLIRKDPMMPELGVLRPCLEEHLTNSRSQVVDGGNPDRVPSYAPGPNFVIGGNRLGRGVAREGLIVTDYKRDP
jgi:hypothetical protein